MEQINLGSTCDKKREIQCITRQLKLFTFFANFISRENIFHCVRYKTVKFQSAMSYLPLICILDHHKSSVGHRLC